MYKTKFERYDCVIDLETDRVEPINPLMPLSNYYFCSVVGEVGSGKTTTAFKIMETYWDQDMISIMLICIQPKENPSAIKNETIRKFLDKHKYQLLDDVVAQSDWMIGFVTGKTVVVCNDPLKAIQQFIYPLTNYYTKLKDACIKQVKDKDVDKYIKIQFARVLKNMIAHPLQLHVLFDDCLHASVRPALMRSDIENPFTEFLNGRRHNHVSIMCTIHHMKDLKKAERESLTDIVLTYGVPVADRKDAVDALSSDSFTLRNIDKAMSYLEPYGNLMLLKKAQLMLVSSESELRLYEIKFD